MAKPPLPDQVIDLLAKPNPSVIATVRPDGQPVSVATWYLWGRPYPNRDRRRVTGLVEVDRWHGWARLRTPMPRTTDRDDDPMPTPDPDEQARRLAAESLAEADPTGWFERLYAAASAGTAVVPWDRGGPQPLLVEWAEAHELDGDGRRALVVGCGLGDDAEFVAGRGFDTVAFDVSATAIETARSRDPDTAVDYRTADLLGPPPEWDGAFDLVVESLTVQSLPESAHAAAIDNVSRFVRSGGTLIVIAFAGLDDETFEGPPWPLSRDEIEAFASDGLTVVGIEDIPNPDSPFVHRWRAEFRR